MVGQRAGRVGTQRLQAHDMMVWVGARGVVETAR